MCNPRGKKNLMMKARILFTMQPPEVPRLAAVMELVSEMSKLLQRVQAEIRDLQRNPMPEVSVEAVKPQRHKQRKGSKSKPRTNEEE